MGAINMCVCNLHKKVDALTLMMSGLIAKVDALTTNLGNISTKIDNISTELDLTEITNLATDSNTRIQGMQTDLATTKGNTESLGTELAEVKGRGMYTFNNTQAILDKVGDIQDALVCTCDSPSCDEPTECPTV